MLLKTYIYFTSMVIHITEKYPNRAWCLEPAQAVRPFDNHRSIVIFENLFQSQSVQSSSFNSIEIDMINPDPAGVLVDQRKCRAGYVVDVGNTKSVRQPFREYRFPST